MSFHLRLSVCGGELFGRFVRTRALLFFGIQGFGFGWVLFLLHCPTIVSSFGRSFACSHLVRASIPSLQNHLLLPSEELSFATC